MDAREQKPLAPIKATPNGADQGTHWRRNLFNHVSSTQALVLSDPIGSDEGPTGRLLCRNHIVAWGRLL